MLRYPQLNQKLASMQDCSIETAKGRLWNQFEQLHLQQGNSRAEANLEASSSSFVAKSSNVKCFNCGKHGHIRSQYRSNCGNLSEQCEEKRQFDRARSNQQFVKCYWCGVKCHISKNCATWDSKNEKSSEASEQQSDSKEKAKAIIFQFHGIIGSHGQQKGALLYRLRCYFTLY